MGECPYKGAFLVPMHQQKYESHHCIKGYWNINGITYSYHNNQSFQFKSSVIKTNNCDILCTSETLMKEKHSLEINGYSWIRHNRTDVYARTYWSSGLIGMLLHNCLSNYFNHVILTIDNNAYCVLTSPLETIMVSQWWFSVVTFHQQIPLEALVQTNILKNCFASSIAI